MAFNDDVKSTSRSSSENKSSATLSGLAAWRQNKKMPFSRAMGGESLVKFQKAMQSALIELNINEDEGYDLVQIDCNQSGLPVSSSLLLKAEQLGSQTYVSVFTYLIAASAGRLVPRTIQSNGGTYEIPVVPGDLFDDHYWEHISQLVTAHLGIPGIQVIDGGAMVIPADYDLEDVDGVIRSTAYYGIAGVLAGLDFHLKAQSENFTVAAVGKRDRLVAHMEYNPEQIFDAVGNPVRGDVAITISGIPEQANQPGQQLSNQQRAMPMVRVAGFVDLIYHEKAAMGIQIDPVQQMMMINNGFQFPKTYYVPRFVQTLNEAYFDEVSLETILFGFLAVNLLNTNLAWTHVFKPRYGVPAEEDLRDIGAVGYEVMLSEAGLCKIDTRAATFTGEKLADILRRTIAPEMVFSVDIPEVGEMSLIQDIFRRAAEGNPDANRQLIQAADHMLCGKFSEFFPVGAPFVINDNNRVPLGVYQHGAETRDLRDLDYLAMLNLIGDRDMNAVMNWSSANDDINIPEEIRLDTKCRLIANALNDAKITGWARRITVSKEAAKALGEAFRANGLVISPENMIQVNSSSQRGNSVALQAAMGPQAMGSGIFSMQTPQYQAGGMTNFGRNRW